jgi:hypothetical protein
MVRVCQGWRGRNGEIESILSKEKLVRPRLAAEAGGHVDDVHHAIISVQAVGVLFVDGNPRDSFAYSSRSGSCSGWSHVDPCTG